MSLFSISRTCLLLVGLAAATVASTGYAQGPLRLNFGVYSSNKPSALVKVYRPMLKELESSMSARLNREVDIRMQIAKNYDQGISHLINGRVDFSAFGPASYVEAKRMNSGIKILAVENVKNSKVFYGIIAVAKDSPIQSIKELRGKSFAFGNEGSTIGRFLSQLELEQAGIHAGDLNRYEYLGRHDKVGTAVGAGSFDAGALNEKTFKKLVEAGENIRELVRFPNVTKPWIARSGLDDEILQALRESLLQVENTKITASMKINGFLEGNDDDYKIIRKAMDDNQVFFEEHEEVENVALTIPSKGEPHMQAAVASHSEESIAAAQLDHLATTLNSELVTRIHDNDHQVVTVNIVLPRTLFNTDDTSGPKSIVINLMIPDSVTTTSSQVPTVQ